ncbi:MAG TPA: ABC transporter permease [Candidatus Binataceae bacterium]|nr:ABC transporter permease [Candidatus Binataceae bacterium]
MVPIRYNLRSLMVRRTTSAMTALGIALVVMVMFLLLGFVAGLRTTMAREGEPHDWIVLSRAVTAEPSSSITREQYEILRSRAELAQDRSGAPLISPETVTAFNPTPDGPIDASSFTFLRGVYPIAFEVHRGIRIVSGRMPAAGTTEMIIGRRLAARFPALAPPRVIRFGRHQWNIVGIFSDEGSARESEVWTDLDLLEQDVHMGGIYSTMHVTLRPGMGASFKAALTHDARLELDAMPEARFYAAQSHLADQLRNLGIVVALILGVGAMFGGMNTMYAAVARRAREIGVLRVLGFSRQSIVLSFVFESIILGLAGGVAGEILGVAVAYATGLESRMMNVATFIFSFRLAPAAFVSGLIVAAIIGVLGGILPALRAARIAVVDSLRDA